MKYEVYHDDTFQIDGEWCDGFWMFHGVVLKPWTKGRLKALRSLMTLFASTTEYPVYAFQGPNCDPKKRKFIQQIGGIPSHFYKNSEGDLVEIFCFYPLD